MNIKGKIASWISPRDGEIGLVCNKSWFYYWSIKQSSSKIISRKNNNKHLPKLWQHQGREIEVYLNSYRNQIQKQVNSFDIPVKNFFKDRLSKRLFLSQNPWGGIYIPAMRWVQLCQPSCTDEQKELGKAWELQKHIWEVCFLRKFPYSMHLRNWDNFKLFFFYNDFPKVKMTYLLLTSLP